jgi:hypothetical protein
VQRVDELVAVVEELREQLQQKDAAGVLASRELEAEKSTAHGLRRSLQERNEEVCLPLLHSRACVVVRVGSCGVGGCDSDAGAARCRVVDEHSVRAEGEAAPPSAGGRG